MSDETPDRPRVQCWAIVGANNTVSGGVLSSAPTREYLRVLNESDAARPGAHRRGPFVAVQLREVRPGDPDA